MVAQNRGQESLQEKLGRDDASMLWLLEAKHTMHA